MLNVSPHLPRQGATLQTDPSLCPLFPNTSIWLFLSPMRPIMPVESQHTDSKDLIAASEWQNQNQVMKKFIYKLLNIYILVILHSSNKWIQAKNTKWKCTRLPRGITNPHTFTPGSVYNSQFTQCYLCFISKQKKSIQTKGIFFFFFLSI